MPQKPPAIIYIIKCKNPQIKGCYIGSTLNFKTRLNTHKQSSINSKRLLYEYIRLTGGFKKWTMEPLAFIPNWRSDKDYREVEKTFIQMYKPFYNQNIPNRTLNDWKKENKERIAIHNHTWRVKNLEKQKKARSDYAKKNREKLRQNTADYYKKNRKKILELNNYKMTCVCGCRISRFHLKNGKHKHSLRHHNNLLEKLKEGREKLKSNNLNINPLV